MDAQVSAIAASVADSSKNCFRMSDCRAPRLFLMPISFVRSVTATSMMFMMTIAPTINAMVGTTMITMNVVPNMLSRNPAIASGVMIPNVSFSPNSSLRFNRINVRASSTASL